MAKEPKTKAQEDVKTGDGPQFNIHRIYVKGSEFKSPNGTNYFRDQNWKPTYELNLKTDSKVVDNNIHEVTLIATLAAKVDDKTAFTVEVEQAGMFSIANFKDEQLKQMLGSFCPNVLFPYVREAMSDLVNRGGFPQVYLAPVNFDALYRQKEAKATKEAK